MEKSPELKGSANIKCQDCPGQQLRSNVSGQSVTNYRKHDEPSSSPVPIRPLRPIQDSTQSQANDIAEDAGPPSSSKEKTIGIIFKDVKEEPFCMMHTVQQSVIFQDLDFNYITSRIAVMSYPAESFEPMYKNRVETVREFLDLRHPEHYAVFNVSGRAYSSVKFKAKVHEAGWPVNKAPPFNTLVSLCKNMYLYLRQDPRNVCIIHCLDGQTSSAVLACAFLMFCKLFKRSEDALEMFAMHRCPVNMTPSQLRYMQYIANIVNDPLVLPHSNAVIIHSITMRPVPLFNEFQSEFRPFVEVYKGEECILTSAQDCRDIHPYNYTDNLATVDLAAVVVRDVTIIVYHVKQDFFENIPGKIAALKLFQLQFYSGFISPDAHTINFNLNELDSIHEPSRYPDDFTLSLLVSSQQSCGSSPLLSKVSKLKLNPKLLFNVDEDLEAFTPDFMNKENIAESDEITVSSECSHGLNWDEGSENFENAAVDFIDPESDRLIELSPVENLNEDSSMGPFCIDPLNLRFHSPASKHKIFKGNVPLVNVSDVDSDASCLSDDFDLVTDLQNLPATTTTHEVSSSSNSCDHLLKDVSSATEKLHCPVSNSFCLPLNVKTPDVGNPRFDSFDFFVSDTTDALDYLKANSSTQSELPNFSCLISSASTSDVSSENNEDTVPGECCDVQSPFPLSMDTTATVEGTKSGGKQSFLRNIVTGVISRNMSTPSFKAFTKNKSDPFAFLENLSSSFALPTGEGRKQNAFQTFIAQNFQSSQRYVDSSAFSERSQKPQISKPTLSERTRQTYKGSCFASVCMEKDGGSTRKYSSIKPHLDGSEFEDLLKSQGFSGSRRKPEEPKSIANLQRMELVKEMDPEHLKVLDWVSCKEHNIRALLCSLHTVLWEDSRWQEVGMHKMLSAADVKKCYRKACLAIHPDKQMGTEHENLARLIFMELKDAWNKFEKQSDRS